MLFAGPNFNIKHNECLSVSNCLRSMSRKDTPVQLY